LAKKSDPPTSGCTRFIKRVYAARISSSDAPAFSPEDFESLSGAHLITGPNIALTIPPLLLPSALSRGSFLFLLLLLPAASCKRGLRPGVSLLGGELVEARGLAIVFRQVTTALRIEESEIALSTGVAYQLAAAASSRWDTAAIIIHAREIELGIGIALVGRLAIPKQRGTP
jgi:hypothetical protein